MKRAQVISSLRAAIKEGRGVVPLIGSGMSAASGIPSGADYRAYLFHCLRRVFTPEPDAFWNPRSLLWPAFSEVPKIRNLTQEMIRWSSDLQALVRSEIDVSERQGAFSRATADDRDGRLQASGSVLDWRATLHLLSRVVLDEPGKGKVSIKDADPRVIDSFFVNLTEGRSPNAAHCLLAHLADSLRIEVMLTTNFDTLIETAFQRLDMPVVTFDVHYDAGLPDDRLVRSHRSLVKLHGGRYGLRADFSLDEHPQQGEIDKFCAYLAPYSDPLGSASEGAAPVSNRRGPVVGETSTPNRDLLVMGASGEDRRTIALICHALSRSSTLKVHWICYRQREIEQVRAAFVEGWNEVDKRALRRRDAQDALSSRVQIALAPDLTLFLLELYQHTFLSLPPSRVGFPAVWPCPPSPLRDLIDESSPRSTLEMREAFRVEVERLSRAVSDASQPIANRVERASVLLVSGPPGASSVASQVYSDMTGRFHTLWLNLKERFDAIDFSILLLASLAREAGTEPPFPLERAGLSESRRDYLCQLVGRVARPFVVFIDARDLPSGSAWRGDMPGLAQVLLWLGEKDDITVVVVGWGDEDDPSSFHVRLRHELLAQKADGLGPKVGVTTHRTVELGIGLASGIAQAVLARSCPAAHDPRFAPFVLGLTLFRHPCHLSALHSWALLRSLSDDERQQGLGQGFSDNDDERSATAENFLAYLRDCRAIRDDAGNNVFVYYDYREELRARIIGELNGKNTGGRHQLGQLALAEGHQGIADWYVKLYRSSGDVHAAFESIYHRIRCISAANQLEQHSDTRSALIESATTEIGVTLELLAPEVEASTRPLTLVHLWDELLQEMKKVLGQLGRHHVKLERMRTTYLATIGESQPDEPEDSKDAKSAPPPPHPRYLKLSPRPPISGFGFVFAAVRCSRTTRTLRFGPRESLAKTPNLAGGRSLRFWRWPPPSREEIPSIRKQGEPHYRLWCRQYELAASSLEGILATLLACDAESVRTHFDTGRGDELRVLARRWAHQRSDAWVTAAVKALRRYHLLKLYDSEVARLRGELEAPGLDAGAADAERKLLEAERIYLLSAELMRYMAETSTLQGENALLRAQHGILLSWRGRHREAQRRYVEAYGYLGFVGGPPRAGRWATIDLRRTETFLCQLEQARSASSPVGIEQRCGWIYDAVAGVERAAYKVRETAVNIRWYGWLRELELAVCLEIASLEQREHGRFARFRDREGLDECFGHRLESGIYRVRTDPLRLPRYLDLGRRFLSARRAGIREATRLKIWRICDDARARLPASRTTEVAAQVQLYSKLVERRWSDSAEG